MHRRRPVLHHSKLCNLSHFALPEAVEDKSKLLEVDETRAPADVATSDQALTQLRSERAEEEEIAGSSKEAGTVLLAA